MDNFPVGIVMIALGLAVLIILVMAGVIVRMNKRIKELEQPRYGFLGKPLYSFFALVLLVGGIFFLATPTPSDSEQSFVSSDSEWAGEIDYTITASELPNWSVIEFNLDIDPDVLPLSDGAAVGWTVVDQVGKTYTYIDEEIDPQDPVSIYDIALVSGNYRVFADVEYDGVVVFSTTELFEIE